MAVIDETPAAGGTPAICIRQLFGGSAGARDGGSGGRSGKTRALQIAAVPPDVLLAAELRQEDEDSESGSFSLDSCSAPFVLFSAIVFLLSVLGMIVYSVLTGLFTSEFPTTLILPAALVAVFGLACYFFYWYFTYEPLDQTPMAHATMKEPEAFVEEGPQLPPESVTFPMSMYMYDDKPHDQLPPPQFMMKPPFSANDPLFSGVFHTPENAEEEAEEAEEQLPPGPTFQYRVTSTTTSAQRGCFISCARTGSPATISADSPDIQTSSPTKIASPEPEESPLRIGSPESPAPL